MSRKWLFEELLYPDWASWSQRFTKNWCRISNMVTQKWILHGGYVSIPPLHGNPKLERWPLVGNAQGIESPHGAAHHEWWFSWVTNVTMEDSIELAWIAWISTLFLVVNWCVCVLGVEQKMSPCMAQSRKTSGFQLVVFFRTCDAWVCLENWRTQIRLFNITYIYIFYNHASWTSQFWAQQFLGKSIDFRGSPWIRASREFC